MAARRKKNAQKSTRNAPKSKRPVRSNPAASPRPPLIFRDPNAPPRVIIFGAGITGLTVAHELVERGFQVQVVDSKPSSETEYVVEVGGLAANQFAAVNAKLEVLYPYLFPTPEGNDYLFEVDGSKIWDEDLSQIKLSPQEKEVQIKVLDALRAWPMQPAQPSKRLTHVFTFDYTKGCPQIPPKNARQEATELERYLDHRPRRRIKDKFLALCDAHGAPNKDKLISLAKRLAFVLTASTERLACNIADAQTYSNQQIAGILDHVPVRREILVAEFWGHVRPDVSNMDLSRALGLLRSRFVRQLLVEKLYDRGKLPPKYGLLETYLRENERQLQDALAQIYASKPDPKQVSDFIEFASRHLVARSAGSDKPLGNSTRMRNRSDRMEIETVEARLPGEHGYRFFPAFYRHLFDTMNRTPILDENGQVTLETAFTRLVQPPPVRITLSQPRRTQEIPRQYTSLEQLRRSLHFLLQDLRLRGTDLERFAFRLLVFLTSSRERRLRYEELSWIEFLDGAECHEPDYKMRHFSDQAAAIVRNTVQTLLAMDGTEIDAHSYGVNSAQLLLDKRAAGAGDDMTLNGPTSEVWLRPWKRYLVEQGVQFFSGRLINFQPDTLEPLAIWTDQQLLEPPVPPKSASERDEAFKDAFQIVRKRINAGGAVSSAATSIPPPFPIHLPLPDLNWIFWELLGPRPENPDHTYFLKPDFDDPDHPVKNPPDLYVLALPFEQASLLTWVARKNNYALDGDWQRLSAYDQRVIKRDENTGQDKVQYAALGHDPVYGTWRDRRTGRPYDEQPTGGSPSSDSCPDVKDPLYPLRDLSGIQFFFANNTRLTEGHVIYPDSPWGLTAISQIGLWRDRLKPQQGFLGQLSVDLGNFYREHQPSSDLISRYLTQIDPAVRQEHSRPKTAWRSRGWEIPVRAWEQILHTLQPAHAHALVPPRYWHLDEGIVLSPPAVVKSSEGFPRRDHFIMPSSNDTPFLINLPGQFKERPGQRRNEPREEHGHRRPMLVMPQISNGRWVLAGTYMASYTRIMTMEACNESGRHAVNAILHDISTSSVPNKYNSQGMLLGSYCEIFDPYDYEVDDFDLLKEVDSALCAEGLPHLLEILGFERLLRQAHDRERAGKGAAIDAVQRRIHEDWGFLGREMTRMWTPLSSRDLFDLLREGRLGRDGRYGRDDLLERCLDLCKGTALEQAIRGVIGILQYLTSHPPVPPP